MRDTSYTIRLIYPHDGFFDLSLGQSYPTSEFDLYYVAPPCFYTQWLKSQFIPPEIEVMANLGDETRFSFPEVRDSKADKENDDAMCGPRAYTIEMPPEFN